MTYALEGIHILDLSQYIAGPYGPGLLGDLGAQIIKVEPLGGDGLRSLAGAFLQWNQGKRGIAVDLGTDEGRAIVHRLAAAADVVIENYRPGVAARLGVDYETLRALNPRLVYCTVTAYGSEGPYRDKPGVDPLLQARSGVMRAQGGLENPPVFLRIAVCDYTGAMLNAAAISMALYHRARTGEGQRIETSLLAAGALINYDAFTAYKDRPPRRLADPGQHGFSALDRLYATREGWLLLAAEDERGWAALCRALAREDLAADPRFATAEGRAAHDAELGAALEALLQERTAEEWLADFEAESVPAAPVVTGFSEALFSDPHALVGGYIVSRQHASLGRLDMPGRLVRLSETPGMVNRAAPLLGEHTDEVLTELGYTAEQVAALRARRVVG